MVHRELNRRPLRRLIAAVAAVVLLAACGSTTAADTHRAAAPASVPAHPAGRVTVAVSNFAYAPARVTVTAGTLITFVNHDQTPHTATTTQPGFDTGSIAPGHSHTVSLSRPGVYTFVCQFHPFMRGTVIVRR